MFLHVDPFREVQEESLLRILLLKAAGGLSILGLFQYTVLRILGSPIGTQPCDLPFHRRDFAVTVPLNFARLPAVVRLGGVLEPPPSAG